MRVLLGACGAAAAAFVFAAQTEAQNGSSRPESCSTGAAVQTLTTLSSLGGCVGTGEVIMAGCCGDELGVDSSSTSDNGPDGSPIGCRVAVVDKAYCADLPMCGALYSPTSENEMVFNIGVEYPDAEETCCQKCKCYGDPLCEAFDHGRDELILCDGRNDDCDVVKGVCKQQFDFSGRRCDWLKNNAKYPDWVNSAESGSPCQPDFNANPAPEISMYEADGITVSARVGERGVLTDAFFTVAGTGTYGLNSDKCFEFDPRVVGNAGAGAAWDRPLGTSSVPTEWSVSTANDVEIRWKVSNVNTGLVVDIVCTKAVGATRSRIDIECLTDTQASRDGAEGYCFNGELPLGQSSGSNVGRPGFHDECLQQSLPSVVFTCKQAIDSTCNEYTLVSWQTKWCNTADLSKTQANDPEVDTAAQRAQCISDLTTGDESTQSETWIQYMCQANVPDGSSDADAESFVDECVNRVVQDGWANWLLTYDPLPLFQASVSDNCANSVSEYIVDGDGNPISLPSESEPSCLNGVMVEVLKNGAWEPVFYVPADFPPCAGADMTVRGGDYSGATDDLFRYRVRLRTCGLAAECLTADDGTACEPLNEVTASLDFNGNTCTSGGDNCTTCVTSDETVDQVVCQNSPPKVVGSCESCCESSDFLPGGGNKECRDLVVDTPFCNPDDPAQAPFCDAIKTSNGGDGNLKLTLTIPEGGLSQRCCAECALWGDPFGESFNGEREKLIICDSRDATCFSNEQLCGELDDQDGNTCVWHPEIAEQLVKKGDIGAFGSPCLPDWEASGGLSTFLLYETDTYKLDFNLGERSVLENMNITTINGEYFLDPKKCFENDIEEAWTVISGAPIDDALTRTFTDSGENGYGTRERVWTATDLETGIFVKAICVFSDSVTGNVQGGYRLNVEKVIDWDTTRPGNDDSDGYCKTSSMETAAGSYTRNPLAEACEEENKKSHLLCKQLWEGACTLQQVPLGVSQWCSMAYLPPGTSPANCVQTIMKSFSGVTNGNDNGITKRWINLYCAAASGGDDGVEMDCLDKSTFETAEDLIAEFGKGIMGIPGNESPYCASSISDYGLKADSDPCLQGLTLEYFDGSDWVEQAFIPFSYLPCGSDLNIPASNKYHVLFTSPIRLRQCPATEEECPAKFNTAANCLADASWNLQVDYTINDSVCVSR